MAASNIYRNKRIRFKGRNPKISSTHVRSGSKLRKKAIVRRKGRSLGQNAVRGAQSQLKRFRQGSILAVALTGFMLLLFSPGEADHPQDTATEEGVKALKEALPDSVSIIEKYAVEDLLDQEDTAAEVQGEQDISKAAKSEALGTVKRLWQGFYAYLPKILVAIAVLFIAWLLAWLVGWTVRKTIGHWHKSRAITTLIAIAIWLFAVGLSISVVAGDIRALLGSIGLVGLALSWSLQTPIESFTGWLLNSFRGYYRVGDRISVGEVFGDVYTIDFLTTTVWEVGAPYREGFVQAEQPTGRLVTFPNNEVLSGTIVNLTGDFPYVWDELAFSIATESDIGEAKKVFKKIADDYLGNYMREPARQYHQILKRAGLNYEITEEPQVFISIGDSWTDVTIRYLVGARERRIWKSELSLRIKEELSREEYAEKIISVYPRQQVQFITSKGKPTDLSIKE